MKKCFKCNVNINSNTDDCPLCKTPLSSKEKGNDVFPIIITKYKNHYMIYKILLTLSIIGTASTMTINYLDNRKLTWSYFVIGGILSFWVTFVAGMKRRHYILRFLFTEFNIIQIASLIWDYMTGWHGWSITYVLPLTCISYIITIFVLRIFLQRYIKEYIIYTYLNCLIGIIPLIFIIRDTLKVVWPSIISVLLSVFLMTFLFIFNRKQVTQELKRRFHF